MPLPQPYGRASWEYRLLVSSTQSEPLAEPSHRRCFPTPSEGFPFSVTIFVAVPLNVSALWLWALMAIHFPSHELPRTHHLFGISSHPPRLSSPLLVLMSVALLTSETHKTSPTTPPTILSRLDFLSPLEVPAFCPWAEGLNPGGRRIMESREKLRHEESPLSLLATT